MKILYKICSNLPKDNIALENSVIAEACEDYLRSMSHLSAEKGYTDLKGEREAYNRILNDLNENLKPYNSQSTDKSMISKSIEYGILKYKYFHIKSLILWSDRCLILQNDYDESKPKEYQISMAKKFEEIEKKFETLLTEIIDFISLISKQSLLILFLKFEQSKVNYRIHNHKVLQHNFYKMAFPDKQELIDHSSPINFSELINSSELYLKNALEINEEIANTDILQDHLYEKVEHFIGLTKKSKILLDGSYRFINEARGEYVDALKNSHTGLLGKIKMSKSSTIEFNDWLIGKSYFQLTYDFMNNYPKSTRARALLCSRVVQRIFGQKKGINQESKDIFDRSKKVTEMILNLNKCEDLIPVEDMPIAKAIYDDEIDQSGINLITSNIMWSEQNFQKRDLDDIDSIIFSFKPEYYHFEIDREEKCAKTLDYSNYDSRLHQHKNAIIIKLNLNETDATAENLIPIITKVSKFFFLNYQIDPRLVFFEDYTKVPTKLWKTLSGFGMVFYPNIDVIDISTDCLLLDKVEDKERFIDGFKKLGWLQEAETPEDIMPIIYSFKAKYGLSEEPNWSQNCQNYFDNLIAQVDLEKLYEIEN